MLLSPSLILPSQPFNKVAYSSFCPSSVYHHPSSTHLLSIYPSIHSYYHPSKVYPSIHPYIHPSAAHLSIPLTIHLSIYQSVHPSIHNLQEQTALTKHSDLYVLIQRASDGATDWLAHCCYGGLSCSSVGQATAPGCTACCLSASLCRHSNRQEARQKVGSSCCCCCCCFCCRRG